MFLDAVNEFEKPLNKENAHLMGEIYGFLKTKNVEVTARYYKIGLKSRDEQIYQPTADLLGEIGRMKFVRPL